MKEFNSLPLKTKILIKLFQHPKGNADKYYEPFHLYKELLNDEFKLANDFLFLRDKLNPPKKDDTFYIPFVSTGDTTGVYKAYPNAGYISIKDCVVVSSPS
tara:strand:+ start:498 stop:800 length:303 start_codon:yes stop_codon:yes gene_type:complete